MGRHARRYVWRRICEKEKKTAFPEEDAADLPPASEEVLGAVDVSAEALAMPEGQAVDEGSCC